MHGLWSHHCDGVSVVKYFGEIINVWPRKKTNKNALSSRSQERYF